MSDTVGFRYRYGTHPEAEWYFHGKDMSKCDGVMECEPLVRLDCIATLERELAEAKVREERAAEQMTKWQNLYLQACNIRSGPHNFSDSRHWLNDALQCN